MPDQCKKDDNGNWHADQPEQNSTTHDYFLQSSTMSFDDTPLAHLIGQEGHMVGLQQPPMQARAFADTLIQMF